MILAREERRRLASRWLRQGVPKAEIARRLGVAGKTGGEWEKRRIQLGPQGWRERTHPGMPTRLTPKQMKKLKRIFLEDAQTRGYETDLWALKRTAQVIEEEFGGSYTESGAGMC